MSTTGTLFIYIIKKLLEGSGDRLLQEHNSDEGEYYVFAARGWLIEARIRTVQLDKEDKQSWLSALRAKLPF